MSFFPPPRALLSGGVCALLCRARGGLDLSLLYIRSTVGTIGVWRFSCFGEAIAGVERYEVIFGEFEGTRL